MKWLRLALYPLLITLGVFAMPRAAERSAATNDTVVGYTIWPCSAPAPRIWVDARLVLFDPYLAESVALHERDHARYMMERARNCVEWMAVRSAGGDSMAIDMESRAYCVNAHHAVAMGRKETMADAVRHFSVSLTLYDFALTYAEAEAAIAQHPGCEID